MRANELHLPGSVPVLEVVTAKPADVVVEATPMARPSFKGAMVLNSPGCGLALAADELTPVAGNDWCPGATEEIGGPMGGGMVPKGPLRPAGVLSGIDPPEPKPDEG